MTDPAQLCERRYIIYLCRMMRMHYESEGNYRLMIFAEEQLRSAKAHYRQAKASLESA